MNRQYQNPESQFSLPPFSVFILTPSITPVPSCPATCNSTTASAAGDSRVAHTLDTSVVVGRADESLAAARVSAQIVCGWELIRPGGNVWLWYGLWYGLWIRVWIRLIGAVCFPHPFLIGIRKAVILRDSRDLLARGSSHPIRRDRVLHYGSRVERGGVDLLLRVTREDVRLRPGINLVVDLRRRPRWVLVLELSLIIPLDGSPVPPIWESGRGLVVHGAQHVPELVEDMAPEHAGARFGPIAQVHGGFAFVRGQLGVGPDSGPPIVASRERDAHVAVGGLAPDELDVRTDLLPLMADLFDFLLLPFAAVEESDFDPDFASLSPGHPRLRSIDGHRHPPTPSCSTSAPSGT